MNGQVAELENVTDAILTEIRGVMGLAHHRFGERLVRSIFGLPARQMANMLVQFDQDIAGHGLRAAAENLLDRFIQDYSVELPEGIPQQGALLVVSNHPGAYDFLILIASLFRDDLKIISSNTAMYHHLPSVASHFIQIGVDPHQRMISFRAALQHLRNGGALLIFPRGEVELDPALSPDGAHGIDKWSPSIDLFLRKVPQACSVVAIVSGVFSPRWFNHPITRLWKKPEQRQKTAEILQVAEQLVRSRKMPLTPRVSFSPPLTFPEAGEKNATPGWRMDILKQTARAQVAAITRGPAPESPFVSPR